MSNTALLVVDVQVGFIEGDMPVHNAMPILKRIQYLIQTARKAGVPVIYVQHNSDPEIDGPIHPLIAPQENEPIILKMEPDAFYETNLQEILDKLTIRKLIIVGFQTEMCIYSTSQQASKLGYEVVVVENAHSTFDTDEDDAATIISSYSRQFKTFARLIHSTDILFDSSHQ